MPFHYEEGDEDDTGASVLAAVDPNGDIFFPIVCTYKNESSSKIYLTNADVDGGIETLMSPDLKYTVTNGDVDQCYLLPLYITARPEGAWAGWDDKVVAEYESDPLEWTYDEELFGDDDDLSWLDDLLLEWDGDLDLDDIDALINYYEDLDFEDDDWEYLDEEDDFDIYFDIDDLTDEELLEYADELLAE